MVFLLFPGCHGYQVGAPDGVCISQHASHEGNTYQTSECPYKLTFSVANYTLSGEINSEFLGLLFLVDFYENVYDSTGMQPLLDGAPFHSSGGANGSMNVNV